MEAKKAAARKRFDRWARSYERDRRSRFNAKPQREALAALDLQPGDRFLDVGCGTGAAVRAAAATVQRAVGADIASGMVRRAEQLAAGRPRAEFVVADSENLPFADGSFSAVLCTSSLHHYPNPKRALAEMARVLEAGGRLALADATRDRLAARLADRVLRRIDGSHVGLLRTDELVGLVRGARFDEIAVRPFWDGAYAIVTARLR